MIQIDDAGSGSFVGGTCIGMYRSETNEYFFDIIPVEMYNTENFRKKRYLAEVVNIAARGLKALDAKINEPIELCRGYMFDSLKPWLTQNGYFCYSTHITGRIQEVVEKNFELYTQSLGLPEVYLKYTLYPFHFHKLLRWVYADFEPRIQLCKVGWKSWRKIEAIRPVTSYSKMIPAQLPCLKCGKPIKKGSEIKVLEYFINRRYFIYLHTNC